MKIRGKIFVVLAICMLSVFLLSCLIPEKFDVKIKVNKNGGYSFVYDGILTNPLTREAFVKAGRKGLSSKDENEIKQIDEEMSAELSRDKKFKEPTFNLEVQHKKKRLQVVF